jgi:hypothetical protein
MPRRMPVRPTASQTRTPEGIGIIAAPARPAPVTATRPDSIADPNPITAGKLDLDQLILGCRRALDRSIRRYRHPRQLKSRRFCQSGSIALSKAKASIIQPILERRPAAQG